jgi:hypothetical protein
VISNFDETISLIEKEIALLQKLRDSLMEFQYPQGLKPTDPVKPWEESKVTKPLRPKRHISPEGMERIRAAQQARWRRYNKSKKAERRDHES